MDEETDDLQQEIEKLEQRIEELTSFEPGSSFQSASGE
jgi:cell division septum initiation protein DivIVA